MLHYKDRQKRIHIITMDPVLETDIYERLHEYPGMELIELVRSGNGTSSITVRDIKKQARDTVTSRVLIIDVRRQTIARLQAAYSDIARFNRPDFNRHCYSVLLGDGPVGLLTPGNGKGAMKIFLSDMRIDYNPAVFFASPFFYYSLQEMQEMAQEMVQRHTVLLFSEIPERLQKKYFKGHKLSIQQIRNYFRAADVPEHRRARKRLERQKKLERLHIQIAKDDFPEDHELLVKSLSEEGCIMPGEPMKICAYPFFFEKWIVDLMRKAEKAVCGGI